MVKERQAEMRRVAQVGRLLRNSDVPGRQALPMRRKLVMSLAAAIVIVFALAQTVSAGR